LTLFQYFISIHSSFSVITRKTLKTLESHPPSEFCSHLRNPDMLSSDFSTGDRVEVLKRDGVSGQLTYYPAAVLRAPAKQKNKMLIEYRTIINGSIPTRELVESDTVRPTPPPDYGSWFKVDDDVDVFTDGGWHRGIIEGILVDSKYVVALANRSEGIVTEQCALRHHREWMDGAWFPPPSSTLTQGNPKSRKMKPKVMLERKKKKMKSETMAEETMPVKGAKVEVKSDDADFQGAWFGAIVIDHVGKDKCLVEYLHFVTDDQTGPLREVVNLDDVRPYPPDDQSLRSYKRRDKVDAWYNEGWWEGMISRVVDGSDKYIVYFPTTKDAIEFESSNLRPHLDWIHGEWVKEKSVEREDKVKRTLNSSSSSSSYGIGAKVEVKSDEAGFQGAWFAGTIVAVLENDRFMVEYSNLLTDDETDYLKEEVNASDVRPCPPEVSITQFYGLLDVVDAWSHDAWWVGRIIRVYKEMKYRVLFDSKEELEFEHSQLRPHQEWSGGKWCSVPKDWEY
ncbi:Protein AGENET DOMAIN (AGD)-CONTAINING P1, partial [Linum grandiflorum]